MESALSVHFFRQYASDGVMTVKFGKVTSFQWGFLALKLLENLIEAF
ncbi:hypothetical protein [Alkalihalobacillus trypoxylicola]|nr:hypothetical protein [Alkalihalobacillus trypoxylicola]